MSQTIRLMSATDLEQVLQLQTEAYPPEILESQDVFAARLAMCPDHAWVAERDQKLLGYLVCYRSDLGLVSAFGADFAPVTSGNTLYLHDLALGLAARGQRLAPQLVEQAAECARACGCTHLALVAVLDAQTYWSRLGFTVAMTSAPEQAAKLRTYAGGAVYMTRALG